MPCHTRMKLLLRGLLWMFILEFGFMVTSLEPGFLDFDNLPDTNFSCVGKVIGGYYADLETSCQMFHVCTIGQLDEPMDIRFLCLNGTVFDQETRVCERIDEVDCSKSEQFYSLNLELYGNTQPPILEESSETEVPEVPIPKKTTTTTTTTARPTAAKTPRQNFIITTSKSISSTTTSIPPTSPPVVQVQVVQAQIPQPPKPPQPQPQLHFGSRPQENTATDIRFNPEEYKISLSSGGPPSIRPSTSNSANAKPISFQTFSDNNQRVIVTTHSTVYKSEKQPLQVVTSAPAKAPSSAETSKHEDYDADAELSDSTEDGYSYGYHSQQHQPETLKLTAYHGQSQGHAQGHGPSQSQAEAVPKTYQFRPGFRPSQVLEEYKPSTFRSVFHPATNNPLKLGYNPRGMGPTTYRTLPNQNHYGYFNQAPLKQVEKQRIPVIPSIPPLTFSSPAPFSLNRHVETKRFIDHRAQQSQQSQQASQQHLHHHQPPRIVISASASVSDASGRKFNYSLGTIGDTRFFGHAPQSYDDYKEDDVGLDPFYHDVPKIRLKRQAPQAPEQIDSEQNGEQGEKEAIDVLRFLFNWYSNHEKNLPSKSDIPIKAETITEINDALTPKFDGQEGHIAHDHIYQKDYLYEEFDVDKQPNYAGVQRFEKPFLSLQLLKPPFEDPLRTTLPTTTTTTIPPTIEPIVITKKLTITSTTTTPSPKLHEENFYDYIDDNYEPLTYQEELRQQQVKEARMQQAQALADYQQFKESFIQNYPDKEYKINNGDQKEQNTEQNYSLPEYVDDNYEPVVYQHNQKDFDTEGYDKAKSQFDKVVETVPSVPTTPDTLTTLKIPSFGIDNVQHSLHVDNYQIPEESGRDVPEKPGNNYYYDRYNEELVTTTPVQDVLAILTTQPSIIAKPIRNYDAYQDYGDFKDRNQYQYDVENKSRQSEVTQAPTTVTTENYHQVLGILGITTRKPEVRERKEKVRNRGRGKTRFSLKDVSNVPDDVVFGRRQQINTITSTTTPVPPTTPTTPKIETTTQELEYTINANRRTEVYIGDVEDLVVATESMTTLPTTPQTQKTTTSFFNITESQQLDDVKDYVKLGEGSDVVKTTEVASTSTQATPRLFESETETNERYTTIQLQKLIEKVEQTTRSIAENKTVDNKDSEVMTTLKMTTITVPTTLVDDFEVLTSSTEMSTEIVQEEEKSNETTLEFSTVGTTVPSTSQMTTTTTTSTTPASNYISPRSSKSRKNLENSRRRSKSRFRQSQYVSSSFPLTTSSTPATSTTMSTTSTTEAPGTTVEVMMETTTEFPSSMAFSLTTLPTMSTTPTLTHRTPTLNEEIIDVIKNKMASAHDPRKIEFNINAFTANLAYRVKTTPLTLIGSNLGQKEVNTGVDVVPSTDSPIVRSAQPTLSQEHLRRVNRLPTTPISQSTAINVRKQMKYRKYTFSCVDKEVNQFYSDPRDCRLFHYCTRGFTRTQYLDMKFVCDLGTFFDDVRLVCTKEKPARCA